MLFIILFIIFLTVAVSSFIIIPFVYERTALASEKRKKQITTNIEQILPKSEAQKLGKLFFLAPIVLGAVFYIFFPEDFQIIGAAIGAVSGLVFPGFYIKILVRRMKDKFTDQLVDALMIMSSSFRGGLSLVQAIEAVVDEMPDPINSEFSTVLGENKMGVSLEEALYHLYNRMPSVALQQMITAILLARETGGNLPVIFSRIVTNIRESKKIQQNLNTLTLQGKIQGFVMALLPIGFGFIIFSANKKIFMHMLHSKVGQAMLIYAVISEVIGAFLIIKISTFKDF